MSGLDSLWPGYWPYLPPAVLILYASLAAYTRDRTHKALAMLACGVLLAWAVRDLQVPWLHMLYIPYIAVAGAVGSRALLWALLAVPAFEVAHLTGGSGEWLEETTLLALCMVTAGAAIAARWAAVPARARIRREEAALVAPPEPLDTSGLEGFEDHVTSDFLRTVLYAMKAASVSLYLLEEGEDLAFTASTSAEESRRAPLWFVGDALRFRHLVSADDISTLIERRDDAVAGTGVVAAAAVPVIDGNVILGVLAMTSNKEGAFGKEQHMALELLAAQFARVLGRERVHDETEANVERMRVIQEESAKLVTSLDMLAIVGLVADAMERLAPEDDVYLLIKGPGGYTLAYDRGIVEQARQVLSLEGTLTEMAVEDREHKYFSNLKGYSVPVLPLEAEAASALMLPLMYEEDVLGVAVLVSDRVDSLRPRQVDSLRVVADQASISLKNALFHADIKARALTDGLTGLCNHKHFVSMLKGEVERYSVSLTPLSLLMIDIDHFKRVNDTYGHLAGDAVLKGVAGLIARALREDDLPARYGGEEFAVMMPGTGSAEARRVAERIRERLEATGIPARGRSVSVTASIGVATCTLEMKRYEELVERADNALYQAKAQGRNRVVMAAGAVEEE